MAHARQQIRESIRDALMALPVTRYNVFIARVRPLTDDELPAIIITTPTDVQSGQTSSGVYDHTLTVQLAVTLKASQDGQQNYHDFVDRACVEIEESMIAGLSATVTDVTLVETELEYDAELEQPRAMAILTYQVMYRVLSGDFQTLVA